VSVLGVVVVVLAVVVFAGVGSALSASVDGTSAASVDEESSVSPSAGGAADEADSSRGGPLEPPDGTVGTETVIEGGAGLGLPASFGAASGAIGLVTVTAGVVTVGCRGVRFAFGTVTPGFGIGTGAVAVVTRGAGFPGTRRGCHFELQSASACRSAASKPFGTGSVSLPVVPGALSEFEGSEASAFASYSPALAVAYGPPWLP
jgi:hypothetical protein